MALSQLRVAIVLVVTVVNGGPRPVAGAAAASELRIENARYRIVLESRNGTPAALVVSRLDQPGASRRLTAAVRVLMAKTDPAYRAMSLAEEVTLTAGWAREAARGHETDLFAGVPGQERPAERTPESDVYAVAPARQHEATGV